MTDHEKIPMSASTKIEHLVLEKDKPLIICDADEVLVEFARPLEAFLKQQELWLDLKSYALSGNIKRLGDNTVVPDSEIETLIHDFMDDVVDNPKAVTGAVQAMTVLQEHANLVILTNVPHHLRDRRKAALSNLGIDAPVISNSGEKGPVVAALIKRTKGQTPTVFLDDLPPHHSSVARHANHVHRIHFVADQRLAKLIHPASDSHRRIDCWIECTDHLKGHLQLTGI